MITNNFCEQNQVRIVQNAITQKKIRINIFHFAFVIIVQNDKKKNITVDIIKIDQNAI